MSQKTILLVEDRYDDEELIMRALGRNGTFNKVIVVRDGVEALEYVFGSAFEAEPRSLKNAMLHLVLLDVKLPKIDGMEVLKRLRADFRTRFLPIVMLTASPHEEDLIQSYKFGANSVIRKPVDMVDFTRSVQQLGLYWLTQDNPMPSKQDTFSLA